MNKNRHFISIAGAMLSLLGLSMGVWGCAVEQPDELSPTELVGNTEWSDDGPPPDELPISEETSTSSSAVSDMPNFQLPFPCGQVWAGQTRTNHSPVNSVDFNRSNDIGDAVVAAFSGKVTRVENLGNTSYGKWIEIDHGNGYRSRYAHLDSQAVKVGQSVNMGQKIGTVGNTGGSTGAHLHYEVRRDGIAVKPFFNGSQALFFGTKDYTSKNSCEGTGGSPAPTSVTGTVNTKGAPLTIRADASTDADAVGSVADGEKVTISCQKKGTSVTGTYGTTTLWDYIGNGYVSDAYVNTGSDGQVAPTCQ